MGITISNVGVKDAKLLTTKTLTGAAITMTTDTIDTTVYRNLLIILDGATDASRNVFLQFNGDTGNNYAYENLIAAAAVVSAASAAAQAQVFLGTSGGTGKLSCWVVITNDGSTFNGGTSGMSGTYQTLTATTGQWASTAKITSITALLNLGTMAAGTTMKVYGLR